MARRDAGASQLGLSRENVSSAAMTGRSPAGLAPASELAAVSRVSYLIKLSGEGRLAQASRPFVEASCRQSRDPRE